MFARIRLRPPRGRAAFTGRRWRLWASLILSGFLALVLFSVLAWAGEPAKGAPAKAQENPAAQAAPSKTRKEPPVKPALPKSWDTEQLNKLGGKWVFDSSRFAPGDLGNQAVLDYMREMLAQTVLEVDAKRLILRTGLLGEAEDMPFTVARADKDSLVLSFSEEELLFIFQGRDRLRMCNPQDNACLPFKRSH